MDVKLYGSTTCKFTTKVKLYLQEKKVSFEYLDVMENTDLWDDVLEKSQRLSTPLVQINDTIILGYNEEELEKALAA